MPEKIYLNGELHPTQEANIPVSNPSFLHGVGLFETLRSYNGKPFRLAQHIERLRASAERLSMPIGDAAARIPEAVEQTLAANNLTDARIRVTVTPPGPTAEPHEVMLLVRAEETQGYPSELYDRGMTCCVISQYRQSRLDPLAGHKTTSYFPRLIALRDAQDKQCGEGLWFTPENLLAEGCMSNVFVVRGGRLKTPSLDTPILPGVTRATVLELAAQLGIAAEETPCSIDDLLAAEEVFLTNAIMEVMPVTRIERHPVADEKPGAITRQLADAYKTLR